MQSMQNYPQSYFMCKFTFGLMLVKQLGWNPFVGRNGKPLYIRECSTQGAGCKGAHCMEDLKMLPNNYNFIHTNKGKYDFLKLYFALIKTIKTDSIKVKSEPYKNIVDTFDYNNTNFIEVIQTWKFLASSYRKMAKDNPDLEYVVPRFDLPEDMEEFAWSFERITHFCPDQLKVNEAIRSHSKIDIGEMCLGTGINCKHGVSKQSELLCTADFMTGKCNCISKDELKAKQTELDTLRKELENPGDFVVSKKTKKNMEKDIIMLSNIVSSGRMIHFTDYNMVPFMTQHNTFCDMKKEEERIQMDKERVLDIMIKDTHTTKPIVSLGKLGKKK
jgi:hypothetical protein